MNQLAIIENQPPAFSFGDIQRIADAFAKSRMFGVTDPAAALTLCLMAQAEGQHPAAAFRDYSIIQGRPAKKAEAMLRDFITSGGKVTWNQLTDECAEATFSHPAGGTATINWTIARATKAGMGGKDMWKKYPRQMLRARVVSEGVRTVCPMATSGMYVPEEAQDFEPLPTANPQTGEVIEAQAEKVPGIHKIKERLRALQTAGNAAETLEEFNALVHKSADDLGKIKAAKHSWWTGDGEDFEGYRDWILRRRAELTPKEDDGQFHMLIESMKQCDTKPSLENWMIANEAIIEQLDGAESRTFQLAYDLHSSGIEAMDTERA